MSGRGGRNGRGGRGGGRGGRGRGGRGHSYTGTGSGIGKKGLCSGLGINVFDYGQKAAADQMRTSWEKLVQYVGTSYGSDISNELRNKSEVILQQPTHDTTVIARHLARETMVRAGQLNLQAAREAQRAALQADINAGTNDPDAPLKLAMMQNDIAQGDFEAMEPVPMVLTDTEKTSQSNAWRSYRERNASLLKHRGQVYSLILGQCTQLLQDKLKQEATWNVVSSSYDPLVLYRLIEKTILAQTEDQYPFATVYDQEQAFYSFRQDTLSSAQWYERFNTKIDVGEAIGVSRHHKVLLEYCSNEHTPNSTFSTLSAADQVLVRADAEERYISYVFLRQSGTQHANLKEDLQNGFTTGDNRYPKTRQETLHLLDKYSKNVVPKSTASEGSSFLQQESYDKKYWKNLECYKCGKKGHPANHCRGKKQQSKKTDNDKDDDDKSIASNAESVRKLSKDFKKMKKNFATVNTQLTKLAEDGENGSDLSESDQDESSHFQIGLQFTQFKDHFEPRIAKLFKQTHATKTKIKLDLREIILLDSQSTMDLMCNETMVSKVFKSDSTMRLKSNGGTMQVGRKATIAGYNRDVWFSTRAITNIISLSNLITQYRVTYDSDDLMFVVHRKDKTNMEFKMHESGLHYYDPRNESGLAFVNTVSENKSGFTKRQIKNAEAARTLYATLSYPSLKDFKWVLRSNQIQNCPVTVQDAEVASKIWGKNIAALKGKTTRGKSIPVSSDFIKVPKELIKLHKDVYLTADIFFVNKIPFFLTHSRKISFTAVNHLANRTISQIFSAFKNIYVYYLQRGFRITTVSADGEFGPLQNLIEAMPGGPSVNLASANEHVPEIERRIRVVKERCRASRHSLPFQQIPAIMVIHMVFICVKMLNFFPPRGGVSDTMSPKEIMSGEKLDFKKHLALQFGQYCQVHEEEMPRNGMSARTKGAISLGPSGNLQGGYKFMALNTGKKITRRNWDVIPIPDVVVARVNSLGSGQPEQLIFTDRHGRLIGDIEIPGVDSDVDDDADEIPGVDPESVVEDIELPGVDTVVDTPQQVEIHDLDVPINDPDPIQVETVTESVEPSAPEPVVPTGPRRSARVRTQPKAYIPSMTGSSKYAFAVTQLQENNVLYPDTHMFMQHDFYQAESDVVASVMTQLSLKAGMKQWGDKALNAVTSEMRQLHFRDTFKPKHWKELSHTQRQMVLESHMFLKEKRDGKIKGRTVAGGNKQRGYIPKEDASSPTVATESVILSCIIDAEEGRDVAVIDIPNAFIQTRVEDEKDMAFIKIRGVLVDVLVELAPDVYKKYVTLDRKGVKQLLVQCQNALYGTMVASLLYYRKFVKSLTKIGFVLNPYDPCVANKMIGGNQMTICFHVDDCKLSHLSAKTNDRMIKHLRKEYESIFEDGSGKMAVSRGKVHTYLGMVLDYTVRGQVKLNMFDFLKEIMTAFDKADPAATGTKSSAAPDNLFVVNEDSKGLPPEKAVQFHNLVAKTLYATKRARPDTCTSVAFLTTRVREPDVDDWTKLTHLMKYIRGTLMLPLILSANGSGILKWWVDASFAVHPNMRGHSGGGLSLGRGFPIMGSTKQKLNTRSSTKCEVVGADDFMPAICWTQYFMKAQGYGVNDNILFQDNKSSILLETNGKASSGKRTKHINIRYFFITDRVKQGEVSVVWCPTGDMIGDFATKPLQGALFKKFRDQIMGVVPAQDPGPGKTKPAQKPEKANAKKKKPGKGKGD